MLINDLPGDVAYILVADAGVVFTLRRREAAALRECHGHAVLVHEILLLETEPCIRFCDDGRPGVAGMGSFAIRHHDLAHDEHAVLLGAVREDCDGLEHAVRTVTFGLSGGTAVETP